MLSRWRNHLAALVVIILLVLLGLRGVQKTVGETVIVEQPRALEMVGPLLGNATVGQTFLLKYHGLSAVAVDLTTEDRTFSGELLFHLRVSNVELLTQTVVLESVKGSVYQVFEFDPLKGLANQEAFFYLEQSTSTDQDGVISVWGTLEDEYEAGEAVLAGFETSEVQDLKFHLSYEPSLLEKVGIFTRRLAENKPSFWGDARLYVFLGGIYFVLIYFLIVSLMSFSQLQER